ncbi:hypothetical protein J31TS4_15860 [Paenibacillus sp. J31TS4]|uniref:hypothetical protein n=1 Tax=Paenibacillus sp. J31TS4 TaxID=2807195 RepID=UPI001B1184E0|nr:hypothetical protein [Paenibacillus sp. J31TS4]GIP38306.1 hypothetical protein J31TS4_15860 [Paenibacillus sp. J31TS4]
MRELKIGEQTVRVRATPLALLFYRQEFQADVLADLLKMGELLKKDENGEIDPSRFDVIAILQLVWAMAKADAYGNQFPSFVDWLATLEGLDISDPAFMVPAMEEAADGFFRAGAKAGADQASKKQNRRK